MNKYFYALSLCLSGFSAALAQSPGGIGGAPLKLWIKSNAGTSTTTNATALNTWTYANDPTKSFTATGTAPLFNTNAINFFPAVTFNQNQMDGQGTGNVPLTLGDDDYSVFAVWRSTTGNANNPQRIWSQRNPASNSDNGTGLWLYQNFYGDQAEILAGGFTHLTTRPFTNTAWNITQYNLLNAATADFQTFDDRNLSTGATPINTDLSGTPDGAAFRNLADNINRLGSRDNPTEEPFIGQLSELIVYDRPITDATERNRIFSYLGIKYGITIGTNMLPSAGTTPVWDATLLTGAYNNGVFGLAHDNGSGLLVQAANSITTAGQPGNVIVSQASDLADGEFLLIGNNGASVNEGAAQMPPGNTSQRIQRTFLVQHTGNVGTVQLTFDLNGVTFSGNPTVLRDFRLMIDTDGDGSFLTGTQVFKFPVSMVGGILTFNNVTLANGNVFTLISQASAALPVTWKSFTGQFKDDNVHLNWAVESNESGDRYEVEHSTDGIHYNVIGTVKNEPAVKTYNYVSGTYANGANYYRIHQIDIDGKDIYSQVVTINIKAAADFTVKVLNNPVQTSTLKLEVRSANSIKASVELYSLSGVRVLNRQQMISGGKSQVYIPISNIPAGSYVLKVKTNDAVRTAGIVKL